MSTPFFYLPPDAWGSAVFLDGQEAKHMSQVLRLAPGHTVGLLDGRGRTGVFCVRALEKKGVRLEMQSETFAPEPKARAVVALAFSKAVRRGFFLEKAVELGAHGIWLWQGDHSQGRLSPDAAFSCQGQLIAGAKQCRNPWLPEVRVFSGGVSELIAHCSTADHRILPWEHQSDIPLLTPDMAGQNGLTVYVIGPEGGFSQRELSALGAANFCVVSLGARILRCETADTLCLGLHWWSSQLPGKPDARPEARP